MTETAITAIETMYRKNVKISVAELTKLTGLSRGFFYNNPNVKQVMMELKEQQQGKVLRNPKSDAIAKAQEARIKSLEQKLSDSVPKSDFENLQKKYEELQMLENQENIIFPNSPTQNVGYTVSDQLNEVKLDHLMLSLDKTKSINDLKQFAGNKQCIVSVKCDGLSTTLKYIHGELVSAVTRGNGYEGTDVSQNVLTIKNIPKKIPYYDELIIDGETIIGWDTFNKINERSTSAPLII